ncbi:MAG: Rid family hydrolase, partial [Candidatus Didemnitutus sp.]|nr:Rid family hydrolase [Candidatus Didemnitutus sp.]
MKVITAPEAPAAIGPYSHAIHAGPFVFCSGQTPLDPATGKLVEGDIEPQTHQVFKNVRAVLAAA